MRIIIFDIKRIDYNYDYNIEDLKKVLKEQIAIPLLKVKGELKKYETIDSENQIGVLENFAIFKGTIRADLVLKSSEAKEYNKIIEDHLEKDRLHFALKLHGIKEEEKVKVTKIDEIFYMYLKGE